MFVVSFLFFTIVCAQWHTQVMLYNNETLVINPPESCASPYFGPFHGILQNLVGN